MMFNECGFRERMHAGPGFEGDRSAGSGRQHGGRREALDG